MLRPTKGTSEGNFKHERMRGDNASTLRCVKPARTLKAPYGGDRLRRSIQTGRSFSDFSYKKMSVEKSVKVATPAGRSS